ncbi:hypothetical protein L3X38_010903 [Prunus dulcis]|uniref:Uncharacterized protein n=1 Tax=Prunus dulcis TaxID=3755 RepID=A0AAD4ZDS1_PRUDU|nr:hypothetical protein L3X38_010903 [Prunus dulcis]
MVSSTRARAQSNFALGPARARGTRSLPGLDCLRWSWTRAPFCLLPGPASTAGHALMGGTTNGKAATVHVNSDSSCLPLP